MCLRRTPYYERKVDSDRFLLHTSYRIRSTELEVQVLHTSGNIFQYSVLENRMALGRECFGCDVRLSPSSGAFSLHFSACPNSDVLFCVCPQGVTSLLGWLIRCVFQQSTDRKVRSTPYFGLPFRFGLALMVARTPCPIHLRCQQHQNVAH